MVAVLVFAVGAGLSMYKGLDHAMYPQVINNPAVHYVVLSIAMMIEAYVFVIALKELNKSKSEYSYLSAIQRGKDSGLFIVLLEDAAAMTG